MCVSFLFLYTYYHVNVLSYFTKKKVKNTKQSLAVIFTLKKALHNVRQSFPENSFFHSR